MARRNNDGIDSQGEENLINETEQNKDITTDNIQRVSVSFEKKEVPVLNENDVLFEFNYPKDFKGTKWFTDGQRTIISKESAKDFTEQGIGEIVNTKKK